LPTNVRLLHGNPGRRPLNENEPKPPKASRIPRPPKAISSRARRHWRPLAKLLDEAKVLTSLDATALLLLCEAYATWEEAGEKLRDFGLVIKTPSGYPAQSPYLSIANRAHEQLAKLLAEFGMTPSSRTRVSVRTDGEADRDPDAEDLFGTQRRRSA
jgi:P27 family predicted phage terminase small subunit